MSADEAAKYLRLTRKALYEACRRGDIPHYRLRRRLRFRRDELDELLLSNRVPSVLEHPISSEIS